ncbi:hypothetical protein G6F46_011082 [Rhizopus delemar]|uniref:SAP domain-containing protein n=2 Tax=Rhizopus TaxID=4842 RepID=A0A9P6YUT1_9FUNG|nr:hypothetical protein G6F55_010481 [Rhizopus delemar]KAG1536077.1 hypothetical protein G6F51_011167 [Rhizopus arrhizus]KAG1490613.1 hypothetical protein G6F54_010600 [Rhizopus delemar]KAG1502514.1 hypothetical protein G6F53_010836 [Rhizopus delemar]KAG1519296.1 hypothetical protein G6F52_008758 [Rhizopus delemar]
MSEKYKQLKVKDLQGLLEKNGLSQTGKKDELIERLVHFDKRKELEKLEKELDLEEFGDSKLQESYKSLDILKESVLSDDEDLLIEKPISPSKPTPIPAAAVTTLPTQEERPVSQNVFKFTPITFDKPQGTTDKTSTADQIKSDAQRRLERMKRFGVKVSEEEMKQLRAARFGTTTETPKTTEKSKTTTVTKKETVAKKRVKKDAKPHPLTLPKHSLNSKSVMTKKKNRTGPLLKNTNLNQIVTQIHQKKNKLIPNRKRPFLNNKVDNQWIVKNKEKKRVVTAEKNTVIGNGRIITFEANQQKPLTTTQRNTNNHKRTMQVNNNNKRKVHVQENNHNMNLNSRFKKRRT